MPFFLRIITTFVLGFLMTTTGVHAADVRPTITVGTQEVGLSAGYMLPHRLTQDHTTKQEGPALAIAARSRSARPSGNKKS